MSPKTKTPDPATSKKHLDHGVCVYCCSRTCLPVCAGLRVSAFLLGFAKIPVFPTAGICVCKELSLKIEFT